MFQDESLRREIEGLIHPLVHEECTAFFHKQDIWNSLQPPQDISSLPKLAVAEIPLYFEASQKADKISQNNAAFTEKSGPLVIGVHCPQKIRAERLKTNRNWADDMIEKMESWQWDETKKMQACDLVLDNSGTLQELEAEVKKILLLIKERYDHRLQNIKKNMVKLTLA
jgi:23S rRNA pseudouridine1911/1915/1917 synthase